MFAPTLAAVGALAALLGDCSIAVEREQTALTTTEPEVAASVADAGPESPGPD